MLAMLPTMSTQEDTMTHYAIVNHQALLWSGTAPTTEAALGAFAESIGAVEALAMARDGLLGPGDIEVIEVAGVAGPWLNLGDEGWVSTEDCTEWRHVEQELDERLEGLEGLTPLDVAPLLALVEAADAGLDHDAVIAFGLIQCDRLDGDMCGWRVSLAEWLT